jgi:tetratricopeptide (TPR) repeat protein
MCGVFWVERAVVISIIPFRYDKITIRYSSETRRFGEMFFKKKGPLDSKKLWEDYFKAVIKQEYDKAFPLLEKLAELEPDDPQVYLKMGDLLLRKDDTAGALEAYHKSASGLMEGGFQQKALAIYKIILRAQPDDEEATKMMDGILNEMEAEKGLPAVASETGTMEDSTGEAVVPDSSFSGFLNIDDLGGGEGFGEIEQPPAEQPPADFPAAAPPAPEPPAPEPPAPEPPAPEPPAAAPPAAAPPAAAPPAAEPPAAEPPASELPAPAPPAAAPPATAPPAAAKVPEIFSTLSEDEFNAFKEAALIRMFGNAEMVVNEGDDGDSMFMIKSGQAIISTDVKDKTIYITTLVAGDIFGEIALLTKRPRTASVMAFGDMEAYEISAQVLKGIVEKHPKILNKLVEFYSSRVKDAQEKLKGAD